MKLVLNSTILVLFFLTFSNKTYSLTNYQIKRYCRKEESLSKCIKKFEQKRSNLQKGKLIEIPVIPYKP